MVVDTVSGRSSQRGDPGSDSAAVVARIGLRRGDGFNLDVDFTLEAGTTVAMLGPNGAGKSTVVEVLAGLLAIDHGLITIGSTSVDDPDRNRFIGPQDRNVGVVFQDYLLFDHLSVLDNVGFGISVGGQRSGRRRARRALARQRLEELDLSHLADRKPSMLSGGQAQRVAVARALATDPNLLILDEPLAALDVATRTELRRSLADHLSHYPGPRLLITHEPSDAFILADEVLVIEDGTLTQRGTVDEIRRKPATSYVAAVAGTNLLTGTNDRGRITVDGSAIRLHSSDTAGGPVHAVVHPRAISLHLDEPHGSHRNVWPTVVEWIEPLGETTRIQLGAPLSMVADITPSAAAALGLRPGSEVWAALKATEVSVMPR